MARILYVAPLRVDALRTPNTIATALRPENSLMRIGFTRGPRHLEYHYYETLALPDLLHTLMEAEREGYDAAVIGCFYDLGLQEGREVTNRLVITAPCESSLHLATTLGHRFSIIVGLGVPVIDSALAAIKYAEHLVELRDRFGWSHSKLGGYESPPAAEPAKWHLRAQYHPDAIQDLWVNLSVAPRSAALIGGE